MCGIVGCIAFQPNGFEVTEEDIKGARDNMIKRGPDGGGLWISSDRS